MTTTRYYIPRRNTLAGNDLPAPVSPAVSPAWALTASSFARTGLVTVKGGSQAQTVTSSAATSVPSPGQRVCHLQVVGNALPAGPISGTAKAAVAMAVPSYSVNAQDHLTAVLRVVSGDGSTVRGTLAILTAADPIPSSAFTTQVAEGPMALVTAQAGDRLVVEFGYLRAPGSTLSRPASMTATDYSAGTDTPYVQGTATTTAAGPYPWFELTITDPPGPPTALVADPAVDSVDLTWTAPADGPTSDPATGYLVAVDGGAGVDVGNVTAHTVTGLDPSTFYVFTVVGYNAADAGGAAFTDATTLSGLPGPVTGLSVVPDVDTLSLTWTAPAGPFPATGYRVSIDGAPEVDVGNVTAHLFTGLNPDQEYIVTVVAYTVHGDSSPVFGSATTLSGAAYRVVVRLGSHTWDVLAEDPPELGPILPLSFGWAVPEDSVGFPAQPDPETCPMVLVTSSQAAMAGVDIGTTMRVSLYRSSSVTARPFATFVGRVADLEASPDPRGLRWSLLGVGYIVDLGGELVGGYDWPQESGDARAARIMADAGVSGWSAGPLGNTFAARGPGAVTARAELLATLSAAVTAEGSNYGPAVRTLVFPNVDEDGELVPGAPFQGSTVVRRTDYLEVIPAGLVNRNTSWRRTKLLDATQVAIDHPGGPTTYGRPGPHYPPQSVDVLDPQELADLILDTTPGYRWLTETFRLELWATDEPLALDWFYRDTDSHPFPWSGRAVVVEDIAMAPDGSGTYAGMLSAARLVLEPGGRLVVEFRLRPDIPAHSTVTMRWMDEPPGATWADELATDPDGTWYDYRTTPRP